MLYPALSLRGNMRYTNSPDWTKRFQPTIDYHEEGRYLQWEDTPSVSTFQAAWAAGSNVVMVTAHR